MTRPIAHNISPSHDTRSKSPKQKVESYEVGWLFVQEYYTMMNKDPSKLHRFYNTPSHFTHGVEGEQVKSYEGQEAINNKIQELNYNDCRVVISNVDSQPSHNGGIVVQVIGELSNKGAHSRKFVQMFFLAEQPEGYYVLNDIFRFLKEDIDMETSLEDGASHFFEDSFEERRKKEFLQEPDLLSKSQENVVNEGEIGKSTVQSEEDDHVEVIVDKPKQPELILESKSVPVNKARTLSPSTKLQKQQEKIDTVVVSQTKPAFSTTALAALATTQAQRHQSPTREVKTESKLDLSPANTLTRESPSSTTVSWKSSEKRDTSPVKPLKGPTAASTSVTAPQLEPTHFSPVKPTSWAAVAESRATAPVQHKVLPPTTSAQKPADLSSPVMTASATSPASPKPQAKTPSLSETSTPAKPATIHPTPADSSGPKSWANLAAQNSTGWGSAAVGTKAAAVVSPQSAPTKEASKDTYIQKRRPKTVEKIANSIYVRGIKEDITSEALFVAFSKLGEVKNVDVVHERYCAFIEYATEDMVRSAIGQTVSVPPGYTLVAEERTKKGFSRGGGKVRGDGRTFFYGEKRDYSEGHMDNGNEKEGQDKESDKTEGGFKQVEGKRGGKGGRGRGKVRTGPLKG